MGNDAFVCPLPKNIPVTYPLRAVLMYIMDYHLFGILESYKLILMEHVVDQEHIINAHVHRVTCIVTVYLLTTLVGAEVL